MASPALAREQEEVPSRTERRRRDWWPVAISLVIQLAALIYVFGRISERVDAIGMDVQMLKSAIFANQFKR